ncbi:F-box only protein 21 [Bombyx mori]|uniref:F-box only protein 21 n=2 Tax=Bombyx mori TaxID=7091 RepID=Q1HQ58_BOMMO|nr:F-box only protein 21 [Bombyx mori]ABF51283.1 F-box only protein 21 [Bombyx mori]
MDEELSIYSLPAEVISIILKNNDCQEILNFSSTCKHFNELVNTDQQLWKEKLKELIPDAAFVVVESDCHDGDWLEEIKGFYYIKNYVFSELKTMSPTHYCKRDDLTKQDVRDFFNVAISTKMSLAYAINILQDFIKITSELADAYACKKPFTLTEMHYARILLRHLIHPFITSKWVQLEKKDQLDPEFVLNFFVQWVDIDKMHSDEDFAEKIQALVDKVEAILSDKKYSKSDSTQWKTLTAQEKCSQGLLTERQVLAAVSYVIYGQECIQVSATANLDTLDITKILLNKRGSVLAVACIYHAVAKRCGVACDVVAFPNHFFLEWRDTDGQEYKVDLENGELKSKRRCPFSASPTNQKNIRRYCPEKLLQQILSSYLNSMGVHDNWTTQNSLRLVDLLNPSQNLDNVNQSHLSYLRNEVDLANYPELSYNALHCSHARLLSSLSYLANTIHITASDRYMFPHVVVKKRNSYIKYAVGMICTHKKHKYTGIIRGWDLIWAADWKEHGEALNRLEFGHNQPFYYLIIANQSSRYVAQENLSALTVPPRMPHLEDLIAREFTHFNGYAYEPNDEKRMEYPDDMHISNMFRSCVEVRYGEPNQDKKKLVQY